MEYAENGDLHQVGARQRIVWSDLSRFLCVVGARAEGKKTLLFREGHMEARVADCARNAAPARARHNSPRHEMHECSTAKGRHSQGSFLWVLTLAI